VADLEEKGISVREFVAACVGMMVIALIILLGAGLGILLDLPYALTGLVVGVIATWAIIAGSFAGTVNVKCPECGNRERVVGTVGSYQCSNCGKMAPIKHEEPEVILYSAFPTD